MPESKKSTTDESKLVLPLRCPICQKETNYAYRINHADTKESSDWRHCPCGVIFQTEQPKHDKYNEKYIADYMGAKEARIRGYHAAYTYAPIIEELTYGRMLLDVGFNTTYIMDFFNERGWLTWGIDVNKDTNAIGNIYKGDFINYDFQPHVKEDADEEVKKRIKDGRIKRTFDLIWMSHVLEHFKDPIAALKKAKDLLSPTGAIYIATPDIDFITKTGTPYFPHWKKDEHYIMWSERALVRELERLGFNIVMKRRNYSSRFISYYDVHIIAQQDYF